MGLGIVINSLYKKNLSSKTLFYAFSSHVFMHSFKPHPLALRLCETHTHTHTHRKHTYFCHRELQTYSCYLPMQIEHMGRTIIYLTEKCNLRYFESKQKLENYALEKINPSFYPNIKTESHIFQMTLKSF